MKKFKELDKYAKLSIIIILIGVIIRFYLAAIHQVSGDACWQLSNARFIAENLKLPLFEQFGRDEPFWAPPLFHIVSAFAYIVFNAFGQNAAEFAVKLITPIFGSLTLIFSFLVSKKLFNEKTAFYSVIFLAFIPLSLNYSIFSYVEGLLTLLSVLSVYFALNNKVFISAITAGLAILTKYNGIFILPVLFYIIYINNRKNKQLLYKNLLLLSIISIAIGSIWFVRNWIYLGNPVWPFLRDFFGGYETTTSLQSTFGHLNLLNIFNFKAMTPIYLGFFGIPDGNINALYFYNMPNIKLLFLLWLLATIIFSIPIAMGIFSKRLKHKNLLFVWVGSFIALILLYVANASWSVSRFMLPAFPAIALLWAHGLERIKNASIRKIIIIAISFIIIGFIFTTFLKIHLAAKEWALYNNDFKWVRTNTNKNSIFLSGSQCVSYHIGRQAINPEASNLEKANYAFVNQKFRLDNRNIFGNELLLEIKKRGKVVYSNEKTKTEVYKLK